MAAPGRSLRSELVRISPAAVVSLAMLLGIFLTTPATAQIALFPTPALVASSDLVAIVKVDGVSEITVRNVILPPFLAIPGKVPSTEAKPGRQYLRTCKGTIEKVLRDASGKAKIGDKIEFLTLAPPPNPGGHVMVTDGPSYARLAEGQSYQLMLQTMDGGKSLYLPNYFKCFTPVEKLKEQQNDVVADVDQWPWSKPNADGLQMAVLLDSPLFIMGYPRNGEPGTTTILAMFAIRNTSAKPLRITTDPALAPLSIDITRADGKPAGGPVNFYARKLSLASNIHDPVSLEPGQIVFIGETGPASWYSQIRTNLEPGKYKIAARYRVEAKAAQSAAPGGGAPEARWTEKIEAPAVELEIIAPRHGFTPGQR